MLSTKGFEAPETVVCEDVHMHNTRELSTVSDRLDYVMETCKCPTQTAFAAWLGVRSSQVITNWRTRNSIGRAGPKLRAVTGVSTDWITAGIGEPFPDGPILYAGRASFDPEAIEQLQSDFDQLMLGVMALIDTFSARTQSEAEALRERLAAARRGRERSAPDHKPAVLASLEGAAEKAASSRRHRNPRGERG